MSENHEDKRAPRHLLLKLALGVSGDVRHILRDRHVGH